MISTLDILDIVYAKLAASDLLVGTTNPVSGHLYKITRPQGSASEDVVINCLPVTSDYLQLATVNVNIYVPDLHSEYNSTEQYLPDLARLDTLAAMAITALYGEYRPGYFFYITSQVVYAEEATHEHFINLRVEFKNINL